MSMKQNVFVSVFVHECLMMLNDVEYTTFKMFVTQMSNYLFVISFQLMFYKTLCYRLARALGADFWVSRHAEICQFDRFSSEISFKRARSCDYGIPRLGSS